MRLEELHTQGAQQAATNTAATLPRRRSPESDTESSRERSAAVVGSPPPRDDGLATVLRHAIARRSADAPSLGPLTRPVLQRGKNDKWALKAVTTERKDLDSRAVWGAGALHHHISRERLKSLNDELQKSLQSRSSSAKGAAKEFLKLVKKIVEDMLFDLDASKRKEGAKRMAAQQTVAGLKHDTLLYNLPLNLHYGPSIVANDPGSNFDPSTVQRGDRRVTEQVSVDLQALDTYFKAAVEELDDGDELTDAQWRKMTALLAAANLSYQQQDANLFEEGYAEQWVQGAGDAWFKKGSLRFRDEACARTMFTAPAPQSNLSTNPETTKTFKVRCADGRMPVVKIGASSKSVTHFCNRHTYAHFDRNQIKGVNIFWPAGTGRAQVVAYTDAAIDAAWAFVRTEIGDTSTIEDYDLLTSITDVIGGAGMKKAVGDLYFRIFIRNTAWSDDADVSLELDMVAPTGETYDAYSFDVLANVL